jgi:hypothetical protein
MFVVETSQKDCVIIGSELLSELELLPWQTLFEKIKSHGSVRYEASNVRIQEDDWVPSHIKAESLQNLRAKKMEWEKELEKSMKTKEERKLIEYFWEKKENLKLIDKCIWDNFYNKGLGVFEKENLIVDKQYLLSDGTNLTLEAHGDNWYTLRGYKEPLRCWIFPPGGFRAHRDFRCQDWYKNLVEADILLIDFPWQIGGSNPTCGVALGYPTWTEKQIEAFEFPKLQPDGGFVFARATNSTVETLILLLKEKGYKIVEYLVWVKRSQTMNCNPELDIISDMQRKSA